MKESKHRMICPLRAVHFAVCLAGVFLYFVINGSFAHGKETASEEGGINLNTIKCELTVPKKIYKFKQSIAFSCRCRSDNTPVFFLPKNITGNSKLFNPGIIIRDEGGNQYRFANSYYIEQAQSYDFSSFKNNMPIYSFKFPDKNGFFRLVRESEWARTKESDITKREKIYDTAFDEIPPGKYTAWVDNRLSWHTVRVGNTNIVLSGYKHYGDEDHSEIKWEIKDISPVIEFEVK
ncbi:MAG: hypothetical protein HQL27_04580 [Candidatus Omnitrophica bacterium]|nr:hypothetical protein [Candidatus Omnitrophota bacterium]